MFEHETASEQAERIKQETAYEEENQGIINKWRDWVDDLYFQKEKMEAILESYKRVEREGFADYSVEKRGIERSLKELEKLLEIVQEQKFSPEYKYGKNEKPKTRSEEK